MQAVDVNFVLRGSRIGNSLLVKKEETELGYGNGETIDRLFSEPFGALLQENLGHEIEFPLDHSPELESYSNAELERAINSFISLYSIQRNLQLKPRIGNFTRELLSYTRDLFFSLSYRERNLWFFLADYIGNERMVDVLSKIYAESIVGKSVGELKGILGYD